MGEYKVADFKYKIKICDHILDNIYGQIGLTEVEKLIERLPIFKRLHSLSQLGLVKWIFPCALHTRYTHSIGVMHIAGEMASHININMREEFFCDDEIQILRLAALLHDIGHYPLSHNIEFAYKEAQKIEQYQEDLVSENLKHYVNCPEFLIPGYDNKESEDPEEEKDKKLEAEGDFFKDFAGSQNYHHENIGNLIITNNREIRKTIKESFVLLKKDSQLFLNPFFAPKDENGNFKSEVTEAEVERIVSDLLIAIGNLVIGNYEYENQDNEIPWMKKYSALIQLIHSDLDADNLDYLIRDATFSGTSYGIMDMGILLNCLYVKEFTVTSDEVLRSSDEAPDGFRYTRYIVGITRKGIGAVEQFLLGKFMAYDQMILSKYVSILEAMLLRIESEHIIPTETDYNCEKLLSMVKEKETSIKYLGFSDSYVLNKLFGMYSVRTALRKLQCEIVSRLTESTAFDLDRRVSNGECICIGTNQKEIFDEFNCNPLYQEFVNYYNSVKDKKGGELGCEEEQLFSYRFEQYSLTKQIPIEEFVNKYLFEDMKPSRRFNAYYYRFGKGIPILEPLKDYSYAENEAGKVELDRIPKLCIDSPSSALKDLRTMQFVSLRKYSICS